jgi:CheY-like chemotaxis protein
MLGQPTMAVLLVVDDDPGIREVVSEFLSTEGFQVLEARNGREGLELLERARPAAVVLDLMMPVMSGWEFLEEQKSRPQVADIPVIVMTAHNNPGIEAHLVLAKPFEMDHLIGAVRALTAVSGVARDVTSADERTSR